MFGGVVMGSGAVPEMFRRLQTSQKKEPNVKV